MGNLNFSNYNNSLLEASNVYSGLDLAYQQNIDKVFEKGFFLTQLKSDKSIIKNFKNINKGDHILISNSNETLEAEAIKVKNDKGE